MISSSVLGTVATALVARTFCRSSSHAISRAFASTAVENPVECDAVAEGDMPVQLSENPYTREKRKCIFCRLNIEPSYKNVRLLSQFQSSYTGRIYDKHITGLCEHKQKRLEEEILKAQRAGLMGYMTKEPAYLRDPQLFDPNRPFKPHRN